MPLRPPEPTTARPRHRVVLSMTSPASAHALVECSGGQFRIGDGASDGAPVEVEEVTGELIVATGRTVDLRGLRPGHPVVVSWTEVNDWGTLDARVDDAGADRLSVRCEWPPRREQRREFRRFALELPMWICRGVDRPVVTEGRTRDLSGGGVAAAVPSHGCEPGDAVVAIIRSGDRDVAAAATVQWIRGSTDVLGLGFDALMPADQDHLVGLVSRAETRRGW